MTSRQVESTRCRSSVIMEDSDDVNMEDSGDDVVRFEFLTWEPSIKLFCDDLCKYYVEIC